MRAQQLHNDFKIDDRDLACIGYDFLSEYAAEILDAVESGWQPMDTAPRDGSEIILAWGFGDDGCTGAGYWDAKPNYWDEVGFYDESDRGDGSYARHPTTPTMWRPLPLPPRAKP